MVDVLQGIQEIDAREQALITTRAVAARTGMADSVVRPVMNRLVSAGALAAVPRVGGPRSSQYFTIGRTSLWTTLLTLCTELAQPAGEIGQGRRAARKPKRSSP